MMYLIVLVTSLFTTYVASQSLSIVIPAKRRDCLYYERERNEPIVVEIQVTQGERVNFQLYDPDNRLIQQKDYLTEQSINRMAHLRGPYAFCFANSHTITQDTVVEIDYDMGHNEDKESKMMKKIVKDKKEFIMEILKRKPVEHLEGEQQDDKPSDDTVEEIEHKLTLISLQLDRVLAFLNRYKSKMAYHLNVANSNMSYVSYASLGISLVIIIIGMVQVIVLKSLFNGYVNFKIWQF